MLPSKTRQPGRGHPKTCMHPLKAALQGATLLAPGVLFTAAFAVLCGLEVAGVASPPLWFRLLVGAAWISSLVQYMITFDMQKQIGGWLSALLCVVILWAMLCPYGAIEQTSLKLSNSIDVSFSTAWNAVYRANVFEDFSLKRMIQDYLAQIRNLSPFRAGRVAAFSLLGFFAAICFLYPVPQSQIRHYARRLAAVVAGLSLFALQTELAQVLSPTRRVTLLGVLLSVTGIAVGLSALMGMQALQSFCIRRHPRINRWFNTLGVRIDAISMADCLDAFEAAILPETPLPLPIRVAPMGVAGIIQSRRDPSMQRILNGTHFNTPDGMPLVWLGKLHGYREIERVYGPDMLLEACTAGIDKGWTHYFYGAAPGVADRLRANLEALYPTLRILGVESPPFRPISREEEQQLIDRIDALRPDFFWIGISTPKQLYLMDRLASRLKCKVICPVGYAFDVHAGMEEDAPEWVKLAGFQWLHRLLKQPRLWKRYLPDNPRFVFESLLQLLRLRRYPMFRHDIPLRPYTDNEGYPRFPAGIVSLSPMTLTDACQRIENWKLSGQRHYVNVCTADTMVKCFDIPEMASIVEASGMATTDGMPLVFLAKRYGFKDATRVYGPDLMLNLCSRSVASGYSHYFYGSTPEVLEQLSANLLCRFPGLKIAGWHAPPFRELTEREKHDVTRQINNANPDIVWCGLGTPKQDFWVAEFRPLLNATALIAVGAAFDFHAGRIPQAPRWMMSSGLEWLFRLCAEPRRLWRRYLVGNPRFVALIIRQWLRRKPSPPPVSPPTEAAVP